MSTIRLTCHTTASAAAVVADYFDKRWPLDIAEWASDQGHASDAHAARALAQI
ncbi:hypothetical protein [Streptomyces sp. SID11385]|uniref:hypothetical protein n=1 Tax=Streptomyces sp. SID11385 TaxID=2706031 RepID=UPI0013CB24B0|nr:hypothetical protein [Streptomyces sp. SID11385]NEA42719.1 hypothetical protein [Streptomyces sp. SID11385]